MNKPPKGFWRELRTLDKQLRQTSERQIVVQRIIPLAAKTWSWYDPNCRPEPGRVGEGRMGATWLGASILRRTIAVGSLDVYRIVSDKPLGDLRELPDLPAVHERFAYCAAPIGSREVRYTRGLDNFRLLAQGNPSSLDGEHPAHPDPGLCDYDMLLQYLRYGVEGGPTGPPEPPAEPPYVTV